MYSAKRRMLLCREDQGIDLGTPEYLVFQVLSRSNCRLPMLTTLQFAHDPETQANPRAAFFVDFADVRHGARIDLYWLPVSHAFRVTTPRVSSAWQTI